jgi:hypothetical protein
MSEEESQRLRLTPLSPAAARQERLRRLRSGALRTPAAGAVGEVTRSGAVALNVVDVSVAQAEVR